MRRSLVGVVTRRRVKHSRQKRRAFAEIYLDTICSLTCALCNLPVLNAHYSLSEVDIAATNGFFEQLEFLELHLLDFIHIEADAFEESKLTH